LGLQEQLYENVMMHCSAHARGCITSHGATTPQNPTINYLILEFRYLTPAYKHTDQQGCQKFLSKAVMLSQAKLPRVT